MPILDLRRKSIFDQFDPAWNYPQTLGREAEDMILDTSPTFGSTRQSQEPFIGSLEPTFKAPDVNVDIRQAGTPAGEPRQDFQQLLDRINAAYTPQTQDSDRFRQLLDQFPQREEPSTIRKLVAGGMGMDARQRVGTPGQEFTARGNPLETMESVMYQPHLRELSDWKEKAQPFYNAANLERQGNIQERTLVSNAMVAQTQEEKNAIARLRVDAYKMKAEGWTFDTKGPTIKMMRPSTGEIQDTGIKTGNMTMLDKIDLEGAWDVKVAQQRAQAQLSNMIALGGNRFQSADGTIWRLDPSGGLILDKEATGAGAVSPLGRGFPPRQTQNQPQSTDPLDIGRERNLRAGEVFSMPGGNEIVQRLGNGQYVMRERQGRGIGSVFGNLFGGDEAYQKQMREYEAAKQYIETGMWPEQGVLESGLNARPPAAAPARPAAQPTAPPAAPQAAIPPPQGIQPPGQITQSPSVQQQLADVDKRIQAMITAPAASTPQTPPLNITESLGRGIQSGASDIGGLIKRGVSAIPSMRDLSGGFQRAVEGLSRPTELFTGERSMLPPERVKSLQQDAELKALTELKSAILAGKAKAIQLPGGGIAYEMIQ